MAAATLATLGSAAIAQPAVAARLVGGHAQAAIAAAFAAQPAHRRQVIVSIRASTVSPAWAVVKSVVPEGAGRAGPGATAIRLLSSFYRRTGGREHAGSPPAAVRSDLARDFRVAIVYAGSGRETIRYQQRYDSVCDGAGSFTDAQTATVSPMAWRVRFVVDLDRLLAAVHGIPRPMLVPAVSFDAVDSTLSATQSLIRTVFDAGCGGTPTTFQCTTNYGLSPSGDSALSFPPSGLEIAIPMSVTTAGRCDPSYYTLGPSLWDAGAATVLSPRLGLLGGATLPADPYAPVAVSWPADSAQLSEGFVTSPCQGDGAACADTLSWRATVSLQAIPGG